MTIVMTMVIYSIRHRQIRTRNYFQGPANTAGLSISPSSPILADLSGYPDTIIPSALSLIQYLVPDAFPCASVLDPYPGQTADQCPCACIGLIKISPTNMRPFFT